MKFASRQIRMLAAFDMKPIKLDTRAVMKMGKKAVMKKVAMLVTGLAGNKDTRKDGPKVIKNMQML